MKNRLHKGERAPFPKRDRVLWHRVLIRRGLGFRQTEAPQHAKQVFG
jgi:hypothetical protein